MLARAASCRHCRCESCTFYGCFPDFGFSQKVSITFFRGFLFIAENLENEEQLRQGRGSATWALWPIPEVPPNTFFLLGWRWSHLDGRWSDFIQLQLIAIVVFHFTDQSLVFEMKGPPFRWMVWGGAWEPASLRSSPVMLLLLVWGPHFESLYHVYQISSSRQPMR